MMRELSAGGGRPAGNIDRVVALLIANLQEELERVKALYVCLVRERKILCGKSPGDLGGSNRDKERILLDLEATRSGRVPLLAELSDASGVPADRLSLSAVAALARGAARRELVTIRDGLRLLADRVRSLNERNRDLIDSSRRYAAGWLRFLMNAASAAPCYGKGGMLPRTGVSGRFFQAEG